MAAIRHPVRSELIEEIKQKTTKWTPKEVHENVLRDASPEQIQNKMGSLGSGAPSWFGHEIKDFFSKFTGGFTHYKSGNKKIVGDANLP